MTKMLRTGVLAAAIAAGLTLTASPAAAQLDPLLFVKKTQPNVLISIDVANRMQRDADNNYRDNNIYPTKANAWEPVLGVNALSSCYRRKYVNLLNVDNGQAGSDKFTADSIAVVDDKTDSTVCSSTSTFDAQTRINLAKASLAEAITRNSGVVRFGLLKTRQNSPSLPSQNQQTGNVQPVTVSAASQLGPTDTNNANGKWTITRPDVGNTADGNVAACAAGATGGNCALLYKADASANTSILQLLNIATGASSNGVAGLIPAGNDSKTVQDAPVDTMLDDLRTEANRLLSSDTDCRNTVAILVVGGDRGTSTSGDIKAKASTFLNVTNGHRVPIYVILISTTATTDTERADLQAVATNSGGQYFEITPAMVNAVTPGKSVVVPEIVRAVNLAISHAFVSQTDFDQAPDATHPYGYDTEFQVTSPIIGTVNLENAKDINGSALPNTIVTNPVDGVKIPQRSNVMVTTAFTLPGYKASLRAFRVYKPVADSSKAIGYSFNSDGTRLWVACAPGTTVSPSPCSTTTTDQRNIYTALPDGTVVAFTTSAAATLKSYLLPGCVTNCDAQASALISYIRSQPLGSVLDSTPAIMDAPSLDPPPDSDYPAYATAAKDRRSIIWVGANDGMLHGIDARLGEEVWAFIPFNLLPKLQELQKGQPTGDFRFYVDGSPKIADVKIDGKWRTYMVMGEGPGGTFYQTFDVSLDNESMTVSPSSDNILDVLTYFSSAGSVPLKWAFPKYSDFDVNCKNTGDCPNADWGDISKAAPNVEKTVGQTWSDPAVGQVETSAGRFVVLTGSGFFKYKRQGDPNRGNIVAGSTFYVLDGKDGSVLDSKDVGNDGKAETVDSCADAKDCSKLKNALQADVVATGPADSRFITKAYLGDLDGKIWRFDVGLDGSGVPKIKQLVNLYTLSSTNAYQPIFSSMATVNVGGSNQYLFVGTGSDLLSSAGINTAYALLVILDQGTTGSKTAQLPLEAVDGVNGDEKVTSFPAVAGDIVFFSTTTYKQGGCSLPDANLYAFTFIGGPAYDTNNDGRVTTGKSGDSTKVRTTTGARASAPFIVDQHLVFSTGGKVELFGDPTDFNNGVGQAGVRILSWREVR